MRTLVFYILLTCSVSMIYGQDCNADELINDVVFAQQTDDAFGIEIVPHQVFYNPDCIQNDKLVLHMVGSFDTPGSTKLFPAVAANHGFKVINLKYPNLVATLLACGSSDDPNCYDKFREEIIFGTDVSDEVEVDGVDCIVNRTEKLLQYLNQENPALGWSKFLTESNEINWSNIILSGHSQGGGHAAYLAKEFQVERVLMFASPNDYSTFFDAPAPWLFLDGVTPREKHFAFGNLFDEVIAFENQFQNWQALNLLSSQDSILVDQADCQFNEANVLYTEYTGATGTGANHSAVIIDEYTPVDAIDVPVFQNVWEYMLGVCEGPNAVSELDEANKAIDIFPNPSESEITLSSKHQLSNVEIYSTSGVLLAMKHIESNKLVLELPETKGLLILKIHAPSVDRPVIKKIIVK